MEGHEVTCVAYIELPHRPSAAKASLDRDLRLTLVYIRCILSTMKKYNLYLAERQIHELETMSRRLGISVSEVIRRALDGFIELESRKFHSEIPDVKDKHEPE